MDIKRAATLLCLLTSLSVAKAGALFDTYLAPSFNTDYSFWDEFYRANVYANLPDWSAPYGTRQSASGAGVTPPPRSSFTDPTDPVAFWDPRNATITQLNPGAGLITGAGGSNIYGLNGDLSFRLDNTTGYDIGTVVFQFQTGGEMADLSTIRLVYSDGTTAHTLYANDLIRAEYIREYGDAIAAGGFYNRTAIQWDLTGLGVRTYQILWDAEAHSSLQEVSLDTAANYGAVVAKDTTWIAGGAGVFNWSTAGNWQSGQVSETNGNVHFVNTTAATVNLDGVRTVGEITMNANTAALSISGSALTVNTGITAQASASPVTHVISSAYNMGGYNVMNLGQNVTVDIDSVVAGDNYGIYKMGAGTLILGKNNTFGQSRGGLIVYGGTVRIEGTNRYIGATEIFTGEVVVTSSSLNSQAGSLGNANSNILLGVSISEYGYGSYASAALWTEGAITIERSFTIKDGNSEKILGARNTGTGATYSGNINLGSFVSTSTPYLSLVAEAESDHVTFSGQITGGRAQPHTYVAGPVLPETTVNIKGQGVVEFSGADKVFDGNTVVNTGAELRVNSRLAGTGNITVQSGATLSGSGTVARAVTIGGGAAISPGNGTVGKLTVQSATGNAMTLAGGGIYQWEISSPVDTVTPGTNWDMIEVQGSLNVSATSGSQFTIAINDTQGFAWTAGQDLFTWTILTATGTITNYDASKFRIDTSGFDALFSGVFSLQQHGNSLQLVYNVVPEPSRALLLLLGMGTFLLRRRR